MKKKYLLLAGLMVLFIPISVKAENKIYFENNKMDIFPGTTYDIDIKVNSDKPFTEVGFNVITTSESIEVLNVVTSKDFLNSSDNAYYLTSDRVQKSGTTVATITFKTNNPIDADSKNTIKIVESSLVSDQEYELANSKLSLTTSKKESVDLIKLSSKIAPFEFDSKTLSYQVKVKEDVKEFDLVAVPEDPEAKVVISNQELELRKNIITARVTREGLNDKVYRVTVIKDIQEDNSAKIERDTEKDRKEASLVKRKWLPIIIGLFSVLLVDLVFIKRSKN